MLPNGNGWDVPTLQKALDQCTDQLFNNLEACPPLVPTLDRKASEECTVEAFLEENVERDLKYLPGCNPIKSGPNKGKGAGSPDCSSSTSKATPSKDAKGTKSKTRDSAPEESFKSSENNSRKTKSKLSSTSSLTKAQRKHRHHLQLQKQGKMTKSFGKNRPTAGSDIM